MKVAYQGIEGAYSDAAAAALFPDAQRRPAHTFADAFEAIARGGGGAAVVPVENTHAGTVVDVYDLLRERDGLRVVAEAVMRVRHCLLALPGATLGDIRTALSHPQALTQCEAFLRGNDIRPEAAYDTAGAAAAIASGTDRTVAAIASRRAAERYGLAVLVKDIETAAENYTRFFVLAASDAAGQVAERIPAGLRSGPPKTSLVYATANVPGALVRSLQPFATAGLQLTKIESRPSRVSPWEYVFYLDVEGDPDRSPTREAVAVMRASCEWMRVLGTYPAARTVLDPDGGA